MITSGKIDEKTEKKSVKGPYWSFKIDGKFYNWFEFEEGKKFSPGETIELDYSESGMNKAGNPYKNINSMRLIEETDRQRAAGGGSPVSDLSTKEKSNYYANQLTDVIMRWEVEKAKKTGEFPKEIDWQYWKNLQKQIAEEIKQSILTTK